MKRLTALTIAVLIILSLVSIRVYAEDTDIMTKQEYYAAQSYLIAKYKDGKISYSEFQQQTQAVTDEYVTNNTIGGELQAGALNASNTFNAVAPKNGNTVQKYGDNAREYISDYVSDFFDSYTVLNEKSTTDLKSGIAALKIKYNDGSYYIYSSKETKKNFNTLMQPCGVLEADFALQQGRPVPRLFHSRRLESVTQSSARLSCSSGGNELQIKGLDKKKFMDYNYNN